MFIENKVESVGFFGGIMAFFNSPQTKLQNNLLDNNRQGWAVKFILPEQFGLFYWLFSSIILICTLFIYQPLPGYFVVYERRKD